MFRDSSNKTEATAAFGDHTPPPVEAHVMIADKNSKIVFNCMGKQMIMKIYLNLIGSIAKVNRGNGRVVLLATRRKIFFFVHCICIALRARAFVRKFALPKSVLCGQQFFRWTEMEENLGIRDSCRIHLHYLRFTHVHDIRSAQLSGDGSLRDDIVRQAVGQQGTPHVQCGLGVRPMVRGPQDAEAPG